MNKKEAYDIIKSLLDSSDFEPARTIQQGISSNNRLFDDVYEIHNIYDLDIRGYSLQLNILFEENWADSLVFISPTLPIGSNAGSLPLLLCQINWNIKADCRIYLDSNKDIAISSRVRYDFLEALPEETFENTILASLQFYADVYTPIYNYVSGIETFDEVSSYIKNMWGDSG